MTTLPLEARVTRKGRTEQWRRDFIGQHGGRCHYCNRVGSLDCGPGGRPWHIDHKTPLALGGKDRDDNLALSCKRCNLAKNTKPYETFKALARIAFWQPDEEYASEAELDYLTELRDLCDGPSLYCAKGPLTEGDPIKYDQVWEVEGPDGPPARLLIADEDRWGDVEVNAMARLLVAAHDILPRLLAEVRICRAAHGAT